MGYTRYWNRSNLQGIEKFDPRFLRSVKRIINFAVNYLDVDIGDWDGNGGKPYITSDEIALNGVGRDSCESFNLKCNTPNNDWQKTGFSFCKTGERPYDVVVYAILLLAEDYGYITDLRDDGETGTDILAETMFKKFK